MKKFIVQTTRDRKSCVMEVEIKLVSALEDPSIIWLPLGEYRAHIIAPKSLYEKQNDGSLTSPMWYSHAFYDSESEALSVAQKQIREDFDREMRHYRVEYTEQQIQEKLAQITINRL